MFIIYIFLIGEKEKFSSHKLNMFVHLTDLCQTGEFHWLLKIVARLQRELGSLNKNSSTLHLLLRFFRPEHIHKATKSRRDKILEQ